MPYLTPPPDSSPKKPATIAPTGGWDCQIHLFGPVEQYPFDPDSPYVSAPALPETAIRMLDTLGLARAVVVSGGGYGRDYRYLLDVLKRYPQRFVGVILPPDALSDEELQRLDTLGVRGVRFVSARRASNLPQILPDMAAQAENIGWPIHFYPHGEDIVEYSDRLLSLPNSKIVLDHFGSVPTAKGLDQPAMKAILKMLDTGRVWIKLSGPMRCAAGNMPYPAVTPFARALIRHAPDRMVWGSDWPHVNMVDRQMPNDGDLFDLIADWAPDEHDRARILVTNPGQLYGAPPRSEA
ncbi:amidohydrolase family protein [Paralcaligenes sp. KSB-10]|uniref:amidohydrolase family protein n=1 Tax=Paralcaligenes sp. KSB-10 TaxID=2901142 RepID=UPI001E308EAD|nr:amidohydrolase family protein [Paralcaligenes sp. KSB-10]UHL63110.1 amidohydrolase family protein [Paralcaligenes sp. KSB-10]